jgi:hypothetical protein
MNHPSIVFDRDLIDAAICKEREEYEMLAACRARLVADRVDYDLYALLVRAVEERMEQRIDRTFRLIGLIYPPI